VAIDVWLAARSGAGRMPDAQRIARVRQKMSHSMAHLVVVDRGGVSVGMALAEPFREDHGTGDVRADWGHVSMVFVRPSSQRLGVGSDVVRQLVSEGPWPNLSVWTRQANAPAQSLYRSCGFVATGEVGLLAGIETIARWERVSPSLQHLTPSKAGSRADRPLKARPESLR